MGLLFRRTRGAASVEDEREALRRQQQHAAEQLDAMKRELAERVLAVRERERQLEQALARAAGALPDGDLARMAELDAREHALERREQELGDRGSVLPSRQDADERERVAQRLAELREAERLFLRTRDELAALSEALAVRERLVAERERELAERGGMSSAPSLPELAELEIRLRRLEGSGLRPGEDTNSFAAGLESLRRQGTRRRA